MAFGKAHGKQQYPWNWMYPVFSDCLWSGFGTWQRRKRKDGERVYYRCDCRWFGSGQRKWTIEPYVSNEINDKGDLADEEEIGDFMFGPLFFGSGM